ncbi:MAG TPA: ATP-binding protein, partial [Actinomycetota bacterium]|nr:ATP-binding protein [Actinomycetota bacterium]
MTLVFAALSAVVVGIAAVALVLGFRATLRGAVDDRLQARFAALEADPGAVEASSATEEEFAQLVGSDGALRTSPGPNGPLLPGELIADLGEQRFFSLDVATVEEVVPARILAGPVDGGVLIVGVDVEDQAEAAARLLAIVAIGGPILIAVLAALGWLLAGAALRPVERLRTEAAALHASEPLRRLAVPATGDELQRLAETLNEMLDRVHGALGRERRLVDEASHELRTPVGVLQAEVDLALKAPRSREELEAALRSIAKETERLRRLTQDLLVLARSDRGRLPVHRADVDVSRLLRDVADSFAERARREGVEIRVVASDARAHVDGDRVRQAVSNLVDNALRHTGRGGTIEVRAGRDGERLRVAVVDRGRGFSPDVLARAFEPFARSVGGRDGDGAGLGLAIVRA